ncbi:MAG: hypothetical protein HY548_02400 [Elusimicrobia bacterium]|nr:hypothetical protein [Elusimicrobiota bacterium]
MASARPLPPVPNVRIASAEPGFVRVAWADYPASVKQGRKLRGFRLYRSSVPGELGVRIADESILGPGANQFDDVSPDASPARGYVVVAVEEAGFGQTSFGQAPYGELDNNGFSLLPFNTRPFGAPLRGWGEAPFGAEAYGF